jgi:flagellin
MAAIINTNIASLNLQRSLSASQNQLNKAMERLSSGLRINRASDDAAGLAISTTLDSSIRGMTVATRNTSDAISFLNVQESSIGNQVEALQRMRELAVQSANGSISDTDRGNLDKEYQELFNESTRIGASSFNGVAVFGSGASGSISYQIGSGSSDTVGIARSDIQSAELSSAGSVSIAEDATAAITAIDSMLATANETRSLIGAVSSRFSSILNGLSSSIENTTAAKSRIMDADYAVETSALTRGQILQQAGTAMLTQANSMPNIVLSLLKG